MVVAISVSVSDFNSRPCKMKTKQWQLKQIKWFNSGDISLTTHINFQVQVLAGVSTCKRSSIGTSRFRFKTLTLHAFSDIKTALLQMPCKWKAKRPFIMVVHATREFRTNGFLYLAEGHAGPQDPAARRPGGVGARLDRDSHNPDPDSPRRS